MSDQLIPVTAEWAKRAFVDNAKYQDLYKASIADPVAFWRDQGKRVDWIKPYTKIKNVSFDAKDLHIRWYEDGVLNVSANCIDRHLAKRGDQTAIIWEGDDPKDSKHITYRQLHEEVCRFANVLKGARRQARRPGYDLYADDPGGGLRDAGVHADRGGAFGGVRRVFAGQLGGAHSRLHVGFRDDGRRRFARRQAHAAEGKHRRGVDAVSGREVGVWSCKRTGGKVLMQAGRDHWYHELAAKVPADCKPEEMGAEDPLFILYTSGSTGKPKGVLHTTGGYLVFASMTHQYVFDYHDGDVYWCTADVGWVTGHSYIVYGPLSNGATTLMFEGVPNYPTVSRFWEVIDKHKVNIFYTAPTAIRALMRDGEAPVKKTSRASLRLLGSVGEPINPEAWLWYHRVVGDGRCPIVDTWWQTETGGILITPLPGATALKPGSATRPFFGIVPQVVDAEGKVLEGETTGNLVLADSWPGQMRTVYGDHQRFVDTYFKTYPGKYFTGDGCRRDADGYYWITGRVDDVINVSGHRLGHGGGRVGAGRAHEGRRGRRRRLSARHQGAGHLCLCHVEGGRCADAKSCARNSWRGSARKSARSPSPTSFSGRRVCPRRGRAKSCGASCARSQRATRRIWAIRRRLPIRRWCKIWWRTRSK